MTTRLQAAAEKLRQRIDSRYEAKRQAATATVTDVARDTKTGHTTGTVTATIDGVSNQRVFVGAGTGVRVGDNLRVENRGSGVAPEWIMLGKDGSPAGAEGVVDVERLLSTPGGLSLASDAYAATNGAGILANVTAQWSQTPDWEAPSYYEVSYYRYADGAGKAHVSRAPHTNGATASAQISILNLLPGTEYVVAVRAVGYGGGLSAWTADASIITATDATIPATPTGLAAAEVTATSLRFTWGRSAEADFWYYEIGVSTSAGTGGMMAGYPRSAGDTPEHVATVTPLTNYYFRVRALDTSSNASAWSGWSGPHATALAPVDVIDIATLVDTNYGLGIKPSGKIGIDLASPSGLSFLAGDLRIDDSIAGAGLGIANKVLSVTPGAGIVVADDQVKVDLAHAFSWMGNHTWANNTTLRSSTFDSAFPIQGWQINEVTSGLSALTIGRIVADELSVKVFVADETRVDRGNQFWTRSYGVVAVAFNTPSSIGGTVTVTFEDSPAMLGAIFSNNDWVLFRLVDLSASATTRHIWGQVSGYASIGNNRQTWTFTLRLGPTNTKVQAGVVGLDFGTSGAALIHLSVVDAAGAPYIKLRRWTGEAPYSADGLVTYVQIGDLGSVGNSLYTPAGDGIYIRSTASEGQFIVADDNGLQVRGASVRMYDGANLRAILDPTAPYLSIGTDGGHGGSTPTSWSSMTSSRAMWAGMHAGQFRFGVWMDGENFITAENGRLRVRGEIEVTGGSDFLPANYRPFYVSFNRLYAMKTTYYYDTATTGPQYVAIIFPGFIFGSLETVNGRRFTLSTPQVDEVYRYADISLGSDYADHSTDVVVYVVKSWVAERTYRLANGWTNDGVARVGMDDGTPETISTFFEQSDKFTPQANRIVIGYLKLRPWDSDWTGDQYKNVLYLTSRAETNTTIIGPGYVNTGSISAIAAYLGTMTAGELIVGNDSHKVFVGYPGSYSDDFSYPLIAAGGLDRESSPFRLYETGRLVIEVGDKSFVFNPLTGDLTLTGTVYASAGTFTGTVQAAAGWFGAASKVIVDGDGLALGASGKIKWNAGGGFLDANGMYIQEASAGGVVAELRIGRPSAEAQGFVDIDMAKPNAEGRQWNYAIHVSDGGNNTANASALFHGQSLIGGDDAIDRIFNAESANGAYSDGFYATMSSGTWDSDYPFDAKGAAFKGKSLNGQVVASFNQAGSAITGAPVVVAGSEKAYASIYQAEMGQTTQVGFRVDRNALGVDSFVAFDSGGGKLALYHGGISGIGRMEFRSGNGITGTTNLGTPRFDAWIQVWIEGNPNNYYLPLTAFGTH